MDELEKQIVAARLLGKLPRSIAGFTFAGVGENIIVYEGERGKVRAEVDPTKPQWGSVLLALVGSISQLLKRGDF